MSARVWTRDELDRVWRLPEADGKRILYPWAWRVDSDGPVAYEVGPSEPNEVWVDRGRLAAGDGEPPVEVALAVIGAHQGRDSPEWMAEALDDRAEMLHAKSKIGGGFSDVLHARQAAGQAIEAQRSAKMLRRGTVKP